MFSPLPIVNIMLLSIHVLRKNSSIEVEDDGEEALNLSPCFHIPSLLLNFKSIMMIVSKDFKLLISESHFLVFVRIVVLADIVAWVLVDAIFVLYVIPCSNFHQKLLVKQ
jgi:hypothetical protein